MDWTADWFKVGVVLEVVDRFTSPLQKLHIETQKAKKALEDLWGASYKLAELGKQLAVIGGAISGTFAFPVYEAIKYEQVMAEFNKVVGASQRELTKFSSAFMKLSTQIPLPRNEIVKLSASLAQMDETLKGRQLIEFTKMVAKAAFAFDMLPEEAGEAFGQIRRAFGIPTIRLLREVGDTINYLSNTMGAKARDIIDILKRVGGTAQQLGLDAKSCRLWSSIKRNW